MGTELSPLQDRICEMACDGVSGRDICKTLGITRYALASMQDQVPAFASRYARARKLGAQCIVDDMDDVRDAKLWPDLQRAKLWVEQQRWRLSKQFREEFGDRVDVAVNVTVDLGAALRDAKARALRPVCDPADAIDAEYREIPSTCDAGPSDNKSDVPVPAVIPPPSIFD